MLFFGNVLTTKIKKSGCYLRDERLIGTSKYQKHASFLKQTYFIASEKTLLIPNLTIFYSYFTNSFLHSLPYMINSLNDGNMSENQHDP